MLSLQLPKAFVIVFDPVVHMSQFIEVKGEPTRKHQSLAFVITRSTRRPGPFRCVQALWRFRWRTARMCARSRHLGGRQ